MFLFAKFQKIYTELSPNPYRSCTKPLPNVNDNENENDNDNVYDNENAYVNVYEKGRRHLPLTHTAKKRNENKCFFFVTLRASVLTKPNKCAII